jgi:hypothetical protein
MSVVGQSIGNRVPVYLIEVGYNLSFLERSGQRW